MVSLKKKELINSKGGYKITAAGYAQMCKMMLPLANGRVILALEVCPKKTLSTKCLVSSI
jgi:hypothetical protein